jgi:hypothetical protein
MRIPLAAKVSGIVIMIIGLAPGLTVMLNYLKFERTFLDVTESRLGFIAADLRTRIQTGLDLGLDLAAMTNVQPIIDAEAGMDPQILAIVVYDEGGRILFSSGADPAGETIPGGWASALEPVEAWTWRADDPEAIVVGSRLTNNFGAYTGGVALRYSRAFLEEVTTSAFDLLVRLAVIIFVVTAVLAALAMLVLLRDTTSSFRRMRQALEQALRDPQSPPFRPRKRTVELEFADTERSLRTAATDLAAAEQGLQRLSPGG